MREETQTNKAEPKPILNTKPAGSDVILEASSQKGISINADKNNSFKRK